MSIQEYVLTDQAYMDLLFGSRKTPGSATPRRLGHRIRDRRRSAFGRGEAAVPTSRQPPAASGGSSRSGASSAAGPSESAASKVGARRTADELVRLLVVEDDWDSRQLMAQLLKEYEVTLVVGVNEALVEARDRPFDLVVADINLGYDRSGVDLLKELRTLPGYHDVPVIAVTAHALSGDRRRLMEHGFTDYVAKPFDPASLLTTIRQALGAAT